MGNDSLRRALQQAGLQPDELAEAVSVDIRTVRRWLAGGTPHPRQRAKVARALDTSEGTLWPELAATAPTDPGGGPPAGAGELIGDYPRRDHPDAPATAALLEAAREQIDLLAVMLEPLLAEPGIAELLLAKARDGCFVRLMTSEPGERLRPLVGQPHVEIRVIQGIEHESFQRADEQMLVEIRIADQRNEPGAVLHLHRRGAGGIFDRYAEHYERIWRHWTEPIDTGEDLDEWIDPEPHDRLDQRSDAEPSPHVGQAYRPARRWPRQPGA